MIDPDYVTALNEVALAGPMAALAHVRHATSGFIGIPNPHPFAEPGWMFCHNGSIDQQVLRNLITDAYLAQHPLDYYNQNATPQRLDSELFFVYLMKVIRELTATPVYADPMEIQAPGTTNSTKTSLDDMPYKPICTIETAIKTAIQNLDIALRYTDDSQLTFLLSNGRKMWACRYDDSGLDDYYTLYYSTPEGNGWTTVASEPVSSDTWHPITMYHLMTFTPGQAPVDTIISHQP